MIWRCFLGCNSWNGKGNMIISGAARFFAEFDQERIMCFSGQLGSGKSLLSHMIAEHYLQSGYRFVTNMASVWAEDWKQLQPIPPLMQYKVCAVIDEGGLYVRTFKSASALSSFARKLDSYLIFCGKKLPHQDLQSLVLYQWFDFYKNFLLPVKVYRYDVSVSTTKTYHGYIWVSLWQAYYGIYSTLDPGDYPEEILKAFEHWTEEHFKRYGRTYKIQDLATGGGEVVEMADIQADMERSARKTSDAVSLFERKTKRG